MGWRFRKSINLGGGFRINLSKSGIGYSWGVPGYRITKTANGSVRKTYSIPGTGIQYVDSVNNKKTINNIPPVTDSKLIIGDTTYYKNTNLDEMREKDEILKQINQLRNINTIANILIFSMIFLPIGILLKGLIGFIGKIDLNYEFDEFSQK